MNYVSNKICKQRYKYCQFRYPGHVFLFRFGDSYQAFFGDAYRVSSALNIPITARDQNYESDDEMEYCVIPDHCIEDFIRQLESAGHHVATVDEDIILGM